MNPLMRAWSVIGLLFMAAIFATIPISPQVTQRGVEEASIRRRRSLMGAIAELTGDSSVGVRPSRRWLRPSARGLIDALVTQPPPATTTVTTVLPATTTVATALTSASRSAVAAAKCIAAAATTARPPTIGGSN